MGDEMGGMRVGWEKSWGGKEICVGLSPGGAEDLQRGAEGRGK